MTVELSNAADLATLIPPGARIVWSHACGEPLTLIEALIEQSPRLGEVSAFASSSFSGVLKPDKLGHLKISSMGALGSLRALEAAGQLDIVPCHTGLIGSYIAEGIIGCDVAFVQVSPPGKDGRHSFGIVCDFMAAMVAKARIVVAEVNAQVPATDCGEGLRTEDIDFLIRTDRPLVEVPAGGVRLEDRAIAGHVARFIEDGSTLQLGIGAVPDAVAQAVSDRRELGVHSGMIGDSVAALIRSGVITNSRKPVDAGRTITGALIGTRPLYELAENHDLIALRPSSYTHGKVLAQIPNLITINSAIEVDLTGAVNAETAAGAYVGAVGGQPDFVRAGHRSPGGRSIIALLSTAARGSTSRICARLSGPVTTARSDVDVVVTEHGVAELRGQTLAERARRMAAISDPRFRSELEAAAAGIS